MRRSRHLALLLAALLVGALSAPASADPQATAVIVVLRDGADTDGVSDQHARDHGAVVSHRYYFALRGYAARVPAARLAAVAADPRVLFISDDGVVRVTDQTLPTGVNRIDGELSTRFAADNSGTNVAVIDTGIDLKHPDLRVVGGKNCSSGKTFNDGHGHGTHVAGTVAAINNAIGVVGVLPGASLWAVRVLNNAGFGFFSQVICGVDFVTSKAPAFGGPIVVANMSLGGGGADDGNCGNTNNDAFHRAICRSVAAGVTYVVAAGNSSEDFSGFVPAAYNEVLTVTAIADFNGQPGGGAAATCRADVDDTAADFSNFTTVGSADESHTIAGPGVCILSTTKNQSYATFSGTSMASPHVAGTAALCIASGACTRLVDGVALTPSEIAQKLRSDAALQLPTYGFAGDPNSPIGDRFYGHLVFAGGY